MDLSFDDEPKMSREAMKDEALERMELLGLPPYAKAAFKVDDYLTLSDVTDKVCQSRVDGVPEEIKKLIKEYEEKFGALIFHVIHTIGLYEETETYDCLSVSPYESDWDYERDLMEDRGDMWSMSYSINVTVHDWSDSGSIKIENHSGVFKRVL
jgi:hypothetical protein